MKIRRHSSHGGPGWWLVMLVDGRGQRVAAPRWEAVCVVTLAHKVHGTVLW